MTGGIETNQSIALDSTEVVVVVVVVVLMSTQ